MLDKEIHAGFVTFGSQHSDKYGSIAYHDENEQNPQEG